MEQPEEITSDTITAVVTKLVTHYGTLACILFILRYNAVSILLQRTSTRPEPPKQTANFVTEMVIVEKSWAQAEELQSVSQVQLLQVSKFNH